MDNNQYLEVFIEEGEEHLQNLNQNILELEQNPEDTNIVNEIFRSAHTLKGMAATMGFNTMAELTHTMENVLDKVRNGQLSIDTAIVDTLFKCLDLLEDFVQNIIQTGQEGDNDTSEVQSRLQSFIGGKAVSTSNGNIKVKDDKYMPKLDQYQISIINQGKEQGLNSYLIKVTLDKSCIMKTVRAYMVFKALEQLGEIVQSTPSAQDLENENFDDWFSVILLTQSKKDIVLSSINSISEISDISIIEFDPDKIATSTNKSVKNTSNNQKKATSTSSGNSNKHITRSIKVDVDRLDTLMNLVSELIIVKNSIQGLEEVSRTPNMSQHMEYLSRVTTDLHDAVMKVRMIPVSTVFNRFPRVVRDLAKKLDKNIKLNISGEETEVDRTIVDEIGDPLIHLIRNCVDHGLETPEERLEQGKPEEGNIYLEAYHDGNNVVIEVKDDGRGIDTEKVSEKILSLGLITAEELEKLNDNQIIEYLFHPGFSTAQKVSDISGRGVGLDVVKTKIESLGGIVQVETKKGLGTSFILKLPLTLSIIQALLVDIEGEIYAIPLSSVKEVLEFSSDDLKLIDRQKIINYRGKVIPFIDLSKKLGLCEDISYDGDITTIIATKGDKFIALAVSDLIGQQEIVIKSLGKYLSDIDIFSGATILGDGSVALILDINHLN
ncbi:chemotaxis protein CheA [Xylanivirga thermophila]|jgi:two-component system chemotaxis sensor kinase CheA|uniref:chemotaxis protein CheA n=1 Tax=Xylanivirga thermophila TaxID=2496273 RepID=UPI00101C5130|nr:chemotaxis protein CheA [Xylanivirga thermophila]